MAGKRKCGDFWRIRAKGYYGVMRDKTEAAETAGVPAQPDMIEETVQRLALKLELIQARLRAACEPTNADTAKDEVQAAATQLQSIKMELQALPIAINPDRQALFRARSDLLNLGEVIDLAAVFLDCSLRLRHFTERATELFGIAPTDAGRPITDFVHQLEYRDLITDVHAVLNDLAPIRREIRSRAGRWYDTRIRPYRSVDGEIDGVAITFADVSERHQVEDTLRTSEIQLQQQKYLIGLSHDPIFVWDYDAGIVEWNRGSEELYGYSRDEALGKIKEELLGTTVPGSSFAALKARLLQERHWAGELRHKTKDGRDLIVESRLQLGSFQGRRLVLESTRDVTVRRTAERRLRLLLGELTHRVRNTLAVVQAIARHTMRNSTSKEDFAERFEARLSALASAHTLLVGSDWQGADFAELARHQLAPYITDDADRLRLTGPSLSLPPELATPFGLLLHELAANAAKYGSLSGGAGTVSLDWALEAENRQRTFKMFWREVGGPAVSELHADGLGTALIDRVIPGARVERQFRPDGFVCTIELVLPQPADDASDAS